MFSHPICLHHSSSVDDCVISTLRRRGWLAESAIGLALIAALLVAGLERRTSAARAGIAKAENEAAALYETALGPAARRAPNPDALLVGRLRTLERTRTRTDPEDEHVAAAPRAARVLAAWPDTPPARLESMAIDGAGARIVVLLAGNEAAAAFETHWRDQRGWRLQRPRLSARRDGVRLTARLVPQAPEDSPAHPDAAEPGS